MMINVVLLIMNVILMALGQVLFKQGSKAFTGLQWSSLLHVAFNPYVLSGVTIYGVSTVIWVYVLSRMNLSVAYPTQSMSYVLVMLAAIFLFKEPISAKQWIGMGLIMAGVVFVSQGK